MIKSLEIISPPPDTNSIVLIKVTSKPIKLKSISEERALNRTGKLMKSNEVLLTDRKFECLSAAPIQSIRSSDPVESKTNLNQLQMEIALATTRALSSIKQCPGKVAHISNERKTIRTNKSEILETKLANPRNYQVKVTENTPEGPLFISDKGIGISKTATSVLGKQNCEEAKSEQVYSKITSNSGNKLSICNRKILNTLVQNKQKEHLFIDKIKEATIKLRNLREYSSKLTLMHK